MPNERIQLSDTILTIIAKMSEGNPGAVTVMAELYKTGPLTDPDAFVGELAALLSLDSLNIYGSRIWMLYKDVCKQNILHMHAVLRAHQLGIITKTNLELAIKGEQKLDLKNILESVQKQLPAFGATELRDVLLKQAANEME